MPTTQSAPRVGRDLHANVLLITMEKLAQKVIIRFLLLNSRKYCTCVDHIKKVIKSAE